MNKVFVAGVILLAAGIAGAAAAFWRLYHLNLTSGLIIFLISVLVMVAGETLSIISERR